MNILRKLRLTDNYGPTGLGFTVIMLLIAAVLFSGIFVMDKIICSQYSERTQRPTDYRIPSGCFVRHNGVFMPMSEYKARVITHLEPGNEYTQ